MPKPSRIDRMPTEIRDEIGRLRGAGRTIDEILEHLRAMAVPAEEMPSRSGLGRHVKSLDQIAAQIRQRRAVAEALVRSMGDQADGQQARGNIHMAQMLVTELQAAIGENGQIDAETVERACRALNHLSRAMRNTVETDLKVRAAQADAAPQDGAPTEPMVDLPDHGRA